MESVTPWPPIGWEARTWVPSVPADLVSRRVRERHRGPYDSAVVPRIASQQLHLPSAILAIADEASIEIARFDAESGARLAPFGAILLRSESTSSSRIENLTSGAKAIALAELGATDQRNAVEIVGNVHAMQTAIDLSGHLDENLVLAMHSALMSTVDSGSAGKWRTEQVWIGGDSYGPHGATFVPPHHDHVPEAMADLMAFTRRDDIPILAHSAISHAQFETIHPFTDGNGRTGRALIHSMLRAKELTPNVTVPIAAGLLTDVDAYFSALTAYRAGDLAPIVTAVAEASFAAITNARQLVSEISGTRQRWDSMIRARPQAMSWQVADLALRIPVFDTETLARELGTTASNALRALSPLIEAGILTEFTGMRRNRMWQAREILDALDAFAARAGRRSLG
ncbi:Fic family protein [Nocardia cyriacigeorgica]|uniref:Fic family protein n=1 Tax=Nocardia cyriacigeorgica TaxID=135487 RepID=UPI001894DB3B|nr:Fic family protein [Nocardia cyriacigeorgica]MBF6091525.1 Fic family protein [Nocardia cyriacigeorgica]MBF6394839.1 Fic family protein [Nocardia cyriacigeorgica]MBF6400473.1 Fic family protein [Nocardia cyriacigeorgica]